MRPSDLIITMDINENSEFAIKTKRDNNESKINKRKKIISDNDDSSSDEDEDDKSYKKIEETSDEDYVEETSEYETDTSSDDNSEKSVDEKEELYEYISEKKWFNQMTEFNKEHTIDSLYEITKISDDLPTIIDVIDSNVKLEKKRELISELMSIYETTNLDRLVEPSYFEDMAEITAKFKHETEVIIPQPVSRVIPSTIIKPIEKKIHESSFEPHIKKLLTEKYNSVKKFSLCNNEDSDKTIRWVETALKLPQTKKIVADEFDGQSISNLLTSIISKMNDKMFGMSESKEEVASMISNMIIHPNSKNKIIGLMGPPGIGKTSIIKSVFEITSLPFAQISMGGAHDSSFLDGHSMTYIGSEPGIIVKTITQMGAKNGIIFIDEVDKISQTYSGDAVSHTLLHILDFSQNFDFRDKYLNEIPIDLSNYIFVLSMNSTANMDPTLISRIPIIKMEGYTNTEKKEIVKKHLLPDIIKNYNMNYDDIVLNDKELEMIISTIDEEGGSGGKSGVRNLKNFINRLIGRINLYAMASNNGNTDPKLSYKLKNFKIPYTIDDYLINLIIPKTNGNALHSNMYI
jgi:ATP-dependent Lon protease